MGYKILIDLLTANFKVDQIYSLREEKKGLH